MNNTDTAPALPAPSANGHAPRRSRTRRRGAGDDAVPGRDGPLPRHAAERDAQLPRDTGGNPAAVAERSRWLSATATVTAASGRGHREPTPPPPEPIAATGRGTAHVRRQWRLQIRDGLAAARSERQARAACRPRPRSRPTGRSTARRSSPGSSTSSATAPVTRRKRSASTSTSKPTSASIRSSASKSSARSPSRSKPGADGKQPNLEMEKLSVIKTLRGIADYVIGALAAARRTAVR